MLVHIEEKFQEGEADGADENIFFPPPILAHDTTAALSPRHGRAFARLVAEEGAALR